MTFLTIHSKQCPVSTFCHSAVAEQSPKSDLNWKLSCNHKLNIYSLKRYPFPKSFQKSGGILISPVLHLEFCKLLPMQYTLCSCCFYSLTLNRTITKTCLSVRGSTVTRQQNSQPFQKINPTVEVSFLPKNIEFSAILSKSSLWTCKLRHGCTKIDATPLTFRSLVEIGVACY